MSNPGEDVYGSPEHLAFREMVRRFVQSELAPGFVVAMPSLRDPNFARSVVLLVEHGPNGSLGFVVNRPSRLSFAQVVDVPAQLMLIAGGVLMMFAVVVYNVAQVSFRQRLCPPALLGRMNASVRFFVWGTMPLGGILGGWLGTQLGVVPTLWVCAAGTLVSTFPVVFSPLLGMRDLPRPDDAPEGEAADEGPAPTA